MVQSIWSATAVTPAATHRIPVDTGAAGSPSRWTGQQIADASGFIGKTHNALGSISTNTAINLANGTYVSATIGGNLTFTITNPPASPNGCEFTLVLTNGGAYTITWPGSVLWAGGTAPTLTASGANVLHFATGNGGTNWYGWAELDEQSFDAGAITSGTLDNARLDAELAAIAGLTSAADKGVMFSGVGTAATFDLTAAARTVLDDTTTAAMLTTLGAQAALVSGTNIKTINSTSLLGSGDIAISASPGGSTTQLQYNNAGSFGGMSGAVWDSANGRLSIGAGASPAAVLHVASDSASEIPMIAQGAASQTAALQEWRNSSGTVIASVGATNTDGVRLFGSGRSRLTLKSDGNDPVVTNDGSSAIHLFFARNLTDYIKLDGDTRCAAFYNDSNKQVQIGFTTPTIYCTHYDADFVIQGHTRSVDEVRRAVYIKGGPQHASATTNLVGGHLYLVGGLGASGSAGAAHGGNLYLRGGTGYGTGHAGYVIADNLPTSSAGLPTGAIWNDAGTLKIA